MHPALSVIFFTTLSGAGLGLMFWLGVAYAWAPLPLSREYALIPPAIGGVLLAVGLLSSLAHLGRPLRAWRALSQWRSSWLSREGVASLATYVPLGGLVACIWFARFDVAMKASAIALALLAIASVWCTSRIYDTLKTIGAWHNRLVLPNYLVLAALSGAWWFVALLSLTGWQPSRAVAIGLALLAVGALVAKLAYWRHIDAAPPPATAETLTGLGRFGRVRAFEAPHTETNYLLREMGFVFARKHADRLRVIAIVLGYVVAIVAAAAIASRPSIVDGLSWCALVALHAGLFVERWLFFAQARHVVRAYYDAGR